MKDLANVAGGVDSGKEGLPVAIYAFSEQHWGGKLILCLSALLAFLYLPSLCLSSHFFAFHFKIPRTA